MSLLKTLETLEGMNFASSGPLFVSAAVYFEASLIHKAMVSDSPEFY